MADGLGGSDGPLTAMVVLEPQFTASGALEVMLATEDGNVFGERCTLDDFWTTVRRTNSKRGAS